MLMNFGPINTSGGEKRLNVIFSRARQHMVVVSSIEPDAITNTYNDGANTLRRFLTYATAISQGNTPAAKAALAPYTLGRRRDLRPTAPPSTTTRINPSTDALPPGPSAPAGDPAPPTCLDGAAALPSAPADAPAPATSSGGDALEGRPGAAVESGPRISLAGGAIGGGQPANAGELAAGIPPGDGVAADGAGEAGPRIGLGGGAPAGGAGEAGGGGTAIGGVGESGIGARFGGHPVVGGARERGMGGSVHAGGATEGGTQPVGRNPSADHQLQLAGRVPGADDARFGGGWGTGQTSRAVVEQLRVALEARGVEAETGVGESVFRCDLALKLPGDTGHRVAVLVDTPERLAADSLLERLTTHPRALTATGWRVHHVLTTDWIRTPDTIVTQLLEALHRPVDS
jgi:hypothetical protein